MAVRLFPSHTSRDHFSTFAPVRIKPKFSSATPLKPQPRNLPRNRISPTGVNPDVPLQLSVIREPHVAVRTLVLLRALLPRAHQPGLVLLVEESRVLLDGGGVRVDQRHLERAGLVGVRRRARRPGVVFVFVLVFVAGAVPRPEDLPVFRVHRGHSRATRRI